jgi:hypothetical protein
MKTTDIRSALRFTLVAAALALALSLAACGDSDDGDASAGDGGQASAPSGSNIANIEAPEGASEDEQQIYTVYDEFIEGILGGSPAEACEVLTDKIRKQFEAISQKRRTCPEQMKFYFHPDKDPVAPHIEKLDVQGTKATALAQAGKSALYPVDFQKVDGVWLVNGGVPTPQK